MINLIHGDCLVEMAKIPDKSVDMVLCDLPYEVLNKSNKNAQMVISKVSETYFSEVDSLDETERGEGGFGSTGK